MIPNELLEADIAKWEHELTQVGMSQLTKAILMTALYVAKVILPQNTVLLPEASDMFIEAFLQPGASSSSALHLARPKKHTYRKHPFSSGTE